MNYDEIKLNFLRNLVKHFWQPIADSSIIPTYLISNKISRNVTVALGGDGADEVFCGYNKYNNLERPIADRFFRNTNLDFFRTSSNHIKSTFGRRELVEGLNESYWPKEEAQYQTVWIEAKLQKLKICGGHP